MRRFILLAFIGTFLTRDITSKVIHRYSSNLSWLFGSSRLNDNKQETRTVCESEECKKMADTILGNMNRSINPCDDFYEYVCGRWQEHNPIPETKYYWDMFAKLQDKTIQQIQEIVEAEPKKDDLHSVKLAKKWYKTCMDTDAIEKQGIDPLVSTLSRLGGWPMIMDKWDEQEYSWQKVDDQYMRLTGRNSFHDVRVQEVSDDSKVVNGLIVEIDTPHLPLGSKALRSAIESDSEEEDEEEDEGKSKSDEDPSNEDEQSDEEHESGSEGEDDSKTDDDNDDDHDNDDDDDDDDDDDGSGDSDDEDDDDDDNDDDDGSGDSDDEDDDDDDDDDDDGSGDNDDNMNKLDKIKNVKKELGKKKSKTGKRSKLLRHVVQRKSDTQIIKKHTSHKTKRQRTKRSTSATIVNSKRAQRFIRRQKLHAQKSERNHVRKVHGKKTKKILSNEVTAKSQINEEKEKEITILQRYADYISKVAHVIAKEIGTEISQERLNKDIQDMIQFQLNLIQIVPTSIFNLEFDLEVTLTGFQEWYDKKNPKTAKSKINWVNKIKALFDEAYEPVNDDLNLDIISPSYIKNLLSLLDKTSNRTILNYIHWNFISRVIKTTTSEMTDLYKSWEKVIMDRAPRPRSTICKSEIKDILAYEFVRKYFSKEIARTASNMLSDIQKEVEYLIKQSDWLDNKAKDFALAKVKNLKGLIGYPNWYKNTTIIQEYFKGLTIGSSYYENNLQYSRYSKWKSLRKLSKKDNKIDELVNPIEVNAFYMPWKNALAVTAADFQSPFFAYGRPQAINYGIVGFIIAHEVNHGFDNTGHMYDENGDFLGWFSAMADAYDKKQDCFVEQFDNYPIDTKTNKKIKKYGEQTTGDNIADTMGLQAIFKAYQRKERECETPDVALPGMEDFTNDQLFFISFANLWCEAINSSKLMEVAKNDEHSIGRLRIIGSVSNSDDFATAYNCSVGSPMNPEKKCNIWK